MNNTQEPITNPGLTFALGQIMERFNKAIEREALNVPGGDQAKDDLSENVTDSDSASE